MVESFLSSFLLDFSPPLLDFFMYQDYQKQLEGREKLGKNDVFEYKRLQYRSQNYNVPYIHLPG